MGITSSKTRNHSKQLRFQNNFRFLFPQHYYPLRGFNDSPSLVIYSTPHRSTITDNEANSINLLADSTRINTAGEEMTTFSQLYVDTLFTL